MRVVVLSQWFPPENVCIPADVARSLAVAGHDVTVLTAFPNYPTGEIFAGWKQRPWHDARTDQYEIRRTASYPSHDSSPLRRSAGYLSFGIMSTVFGWSRLRRADVVYVYHPPLTSAFGAWLNNGVSGTPYIVHLQDLWPDSVIEAGMIRGLTLRTASAILYQICQEIYRRAAAIICIAPTMASTLRQRGVPEQTVHVIPNWADEESFFPTTRDTVMASNLGFAGLFTVMFAGNTGHLQGLDVAIRAAAQLQDLNDFRLVLVGDGIARATLETLAADISADNVIFMPAQPVTAMNEVTHCADVQLVSLRDLPLFRGTIPSKLGAVMASGLPAICAVNGDAARLVEEAGAGWSCAAGSVEAMVSVFRSAYAASPADLESMGAAARAFYELRSGRAAGAMAIERLLLTANHAS